MEWLQTNWILIALGFAFVAMHMFGHGGHGGHGRGGHGGSKRDSNSDETTPEPVDPNLPPGGKRHKHDG